MTILQKKIDNCNNNLQKEMFLIKTKLNFRLIKLKMLDVKAQMYY